jgi:putative transposase
VVFAEGHSTRWPWISLPPARGAPVQAREAADVDDRIRSAATTIYQALIEAELTAVIGAGSHERTDARTAQRNGSRPRVLTTTAGDLELRIPKLRAGCSPRSRPEEARRGWPGRAR